MISDAVLCGGQSGNDAALKKQQQTNKKTWSEWQYEEGIYLEDFVQSQALSRMKHAFMLKYV